MGFMDTAVLDQVEEGMTLDDEQRYPILIWRTGSPSHARLGLDAIDFTGGFFIGKDSGVDGDFAAANFHEDSFVTEGGDTIDGFASQSAGLAVIAYRRHWTVEGAGGFPWNDYDAAAEVGHPRPRLHAMVVVKGLDDVGPMVLSLSGHSNMAFRGDREYSRDGVLPMIRKCITGPAKEETGGRDVPPSAFYAQVGVLFEEVGKGKATKQVPAFKTVGQGDKTRKIVVPTYVGETDSVDLASLYVGDEAFAANVALYKEEAVAWIAEWNQRQAAKDEPTGPTAEENDAQVVEETAGLADEFGV